MRLASILAVALLLSGAAGQAQTVHLTLDEALRRGLTIGEEILLSASAVAEAHQQVRAARSAIYPQVDSAISYNRTIRSPYEFELPDGAALPFGQANTWTAQVVINQTLYAAGRIGAGIQIARDFAGGAEAQAREQEHTIALAITEAYFDASLATEMAAIATSSGLLMDQQLERVRLQRQVGNASDLDVLRVDVERENLQPEITAALNARDVATLNLLRLVNLPPSTELVLEPVLSPLAYQLVPAAALATILEGAVDRRPAVTAAEHFVSIREQQVRIARAASMPSVGATARIGEQAFPGSVFPGAGDFRSDWSVGVGVTIPLYDGGRRRAEVRIAEEQQTQAELQLAQLREGVALEIEQHRRELQRAAEQVAARGRAVSQAQHAWELTELSYRVGNVTQLELTNARAQLRQAEGNRAIALHNYHLALARLQRAAGVPLEGSIDG